MITTAGALAAAAFTNVTGIETLHLNAGGNTVTLTNGLVAGSSSGSFGVVGGAGNDTVDASGVTNGMPIVFQGNGGSDTFVGGSVFNLSYFDASDLTAADTVTGGAATDAIVITSAGALAASAFSNVTGIEALYLNTAGNTVTLTDGLVAGSSTGVVGVVGAAGNDTVDASGVTNGVSIAFYGNGGTDSFIGHGATDVFVTAAAALDATDVFDGNGGNDVLVVTTNGAIAAASHAGVTDIEYVQLQSGGSFQFADNLASASQLVGIGTSAVDSFDGSLVTAYGLVLAGAGGADTLVGGSQGDQFRIPDSSFVQIDGNGGLDRIVLTAPAQVFNLTANAAKITDVEVISLASSGASLTLAGADIPQINSSGNSLYVVGGSDDQVDAGTGWVLVSTTHTNAAVAPGVTFAQYHHVVSNADLYVADQIALTIDINDAPTVATSGFAPSFTEDGAPTAVDTGFTVGDVDDANLESASVSITGGLQAGDVLGFTPQFGITDTNAAPDILALSGSATLAEWQTVLQSITFSTTSQAPGASRTVSITVNDGDTNSAVVTKDITVTPVNDAPAGTDNTVNVTEGTPYTFTAADFGFTDTDANALLAVTITTLPGSGTLTYNDNPVNAGDSIPAADIVAGLLVYTPPAGTGSPSFTFQVQDDGGVANFGVDLDQSPNILTLAIAPPNAAPVANDDTSDATEKGGLNNAVAGVDPTGNVVTGLGTGSFADTDAEDPSTALVVVAVGTGAEGQPDNGTVGSFFSGSYGQLRLMADGSYEYQVNQTNALVQGLHTSADTLTDVFHYTIEDTAGAPDDATFTITIHGANDLPQAIADTGSMTEESAPTSFPVRANDTLDPDSTAANTIAITGTVTATGPAGTTITDGDATAVVSGNDIQVTLNADFQHLALTETATVTVPYTLTGDAGDTSSANLTITVNGANDGPTANDDLLSATEAGGDNNAIDGVNPSGNVITGAGSAGAFADTDPDTNDTRTVVAFGTLVEGNPDNGTLGSPLAGQYGSLTLSSNGTYSYTVNQSNALVQALLPASTPLTDTFHYTIQDTGGAQSSATITVRIHGANDLPHAFDDIPGMGEDAAPTTFTVLANDRLDPDTGAANTIATGVINASGPSGTNIDATDVTAAVIGGTQIQVTLGADFQKLAITETATVTVPYTLTGNAGETSSANLTITVNGANDGPTANDDLLSAAEAGGDNNAIDGVNPSGNVITGAGSAGAFADTDPDTNDTRTVVAFGTLVEGNPDNGTLGSPLAGQYGSLTLSSNGTYSYTVNQSNALVQALLPASTPLTDTFHYTIQDTGGAQSSATITVRIHGANDLPHAFDDIPGMGEDAAPTTFTVLANDRLDPDTGAANTIATGVINASGPSGTNIDATDVTAAVIGGTQIQMTLGADFQKLAITETATVTVPYTLTGNAGETSSANLTITVNGANDLPVAVDDTGSMSEDATATSFNVRSNDTLDIDHTAANSISIGTVSASGPAGDGITGADVTTAVVGNQVQITLGADFQNLGAGETATIAVPYTLTGDQPGDTDGATLTVTVNGANDAPVAGDFTFNGANAAIGNTALVVNDASDGAPDPVGLQKTITGDLLAGATDVDTPATSLTITAQTINNTSGTLIIEADGDFTYLPTAGFTGNAVFS